MDIFNYDEPGIIEHDMGDLTYRVDSGKQGTRLALSTRPVDSWSWTFVAEMKWDGRRLTCKSLDFENLKELSGVFKEALEDMEL